MTLRPIHEVKKHDAVTVNGERYQVLEHTGMDVDELKKDLKMMIQMIKEGHSLLTPTHRITYFSKTPEELHFLIFDRSTKSWRHTELQSCSWE